jgi:eukaryotic-like serine/threonine-protein kinase
MTLYANRYEHIDYLGRGVTGEVINAVDSKTGQKCALKFLRQARKMPGQQGSSVKDFQNEFEVLKNLNHPNIAKVYDAGFDEETERFYLATELVVGTDLFKATEGATIEEIEELFVQALRALNYIHKKEILHFDIKPQNFLITKDTDGSKQLKLIDFGFSNFYKRQNQSKDDDNWTIIGTAAYTAPEIILGESYTGAADLYSLGCTFYKAFTRELPFRASSPEEIHEKHLVEVVKKPSETNSAVPVCLDNIFLKLLAKEISNRYQSAIDVIEDINLVSDQKYKIETSETIMSYMPEHGSLIGRDEEFKMFEEYFKDRIKFEFLTKKSILLVVGDSGMGKSRFLEECKNLVRKNFINMVSWQDFWSEEPDKIKKPLLVYGDDISVDPEELGYFNMFTEKEAVLGVITAKEFEKTPEQENVITLTSFTKEQTAEYLVKASGIQTIPQQIIDIIYNQTQGIPLYLTEYMRALFEKGFFRDSHGSWSEELLNDLGDELESLGANAFIKKRLKEKVDEFELDEFQEEILFTLALTGEPSLVDLAELTNGIVIEQHLDEFIETGFLLRNDEGKYCFTNPGYREAFLNKIPSEVKQEYCDKIADFIESQEAPLEEVLFYRGRGCSEGATTSLLTLARMQIETFKFNEAKDNLQELLQKTDLRPHIILEAKLEIASVFEELGAFDAVMEVFAPADLTALKDTDRARILEVQAMCHKRLGDVSTSYALLDQAMDCIADKPDQKLLYNDIQNRYVVNKLSEGKIKEAEELALKAYDIWKNELNETEKVDALCNISLVYLNTGDYAKALQFTQERVDTLKKKPYLEKYPRALFNLGIINIKLGNIEAGEQQLKETIEIVKKRKVIYWLYRVYNELGNLELQKDDLKNAIAHYEHALDLAYRTKAGTIIYYILQNISGVHIRAENWDDAIKYSNFTLKSLETKKIDEEDVRSFSYFNTYYNLATSYRNKGDLEKANSFLQKSKDYLDKHESLKPYKQYYFEEAAEIYKALDQDEPLKAILSEIESIKQEPFFNADKHAKWLEKRGW